MDIVEIDGSEGEGGGQILRTAISLSCVFGKAVRITNVRANRKQPGLRPQHLQAVKSAAQVTNSRVEGAQVGSKTIEFVPGKPNPEVEARIDTGTAGSTTLIAQTLIPIAIFCGCNFELYIIGGTENPFSPTVDYLQRLVVPFYRALGGVVEINLVRRGYYPRGGGAISVRVDGRVSTPHPIDLCREINATGKSSVEDLVKIVSVSRLLPDHVALRQAWSAEKILREKGIFGAKSEIDSKGPAFSPGSSILIYRLLPNSFVGADILGQRGKRAEDVGSEAALEFIREFLSRPSLDTHLADMAVTLMSCVNGKSRFSTREVSSHLQTNLRVVKLLTGSDFQITKMQNENFNVELEGRPAASKQA